jgi:hypothetical protein
MDVKDTSVEAGDNGGVQQRPVGHRPGVQARWRGREGELPQHGHASPGSSHSVATRVTRTSQDCARRCPAGAAPSRLP